MQTSTTDVDLWDRPLSKREAARIGLFCHRLLMEETFKGEQSREFDLLYQKLFGDVRDAPKRLRRKIVALSILRALDPSMRDADLKAYERLIK